MTRRLESASAMTLAIVVSVLAAIVISALFIMSSGDGERAKDRSDRAANVLIVDRALASYEFALASDVTGPGEGYRLDEEDMTRLAAEDGGTTPIANSTIAITREGGEDPRLGTTWMPGAYAWSMRTDLADGLQGWWQLYEVIPIGAGNSAVVAYVRTWTAEGNRLVSEPRVVRAELRPSLFSDYQMVVDGPIPIGGGAVINGRVHSNGYDGSYLIDAFVDRNNPIKLGDSNGNPTCEAGAALSTATGGIVGTCNMAGGAPPFAEIKTPNTKEPIDLLRGKAIFPLFESMCGSTVVCVGPNPSGQAYHVDLSGGGATVRAGKWGPAIASTSGKPGLLIRGNAYLSGQMSSGRLTVAVQDPGGGAGNSYGSANLRVLGTGTVGAPGANSVLGLVVDGDIIPAIDEDGSGNCVDSLHAAVISMSGSLTIPSQFRVAAGPTGWAPFCNQTFELMGSIGSHYAPLMFLSWDTGAKAGFDRRIYRFDEKLLKNPPPMFPTTGPWQVTSWKDAVAECLGAARHADANCG